MATEIKVIFKVTEDKTFLTTEKNGKTDIIQMDLTGGTIEQKFTELLRMIHEANEVQRHTADMSEWELSGGANVL